MNDAPNTPPTGTEPSDRPVDDAEAALEQAEADFTAEGGHDVEDSSPVEIASPVETPTTDESPADAEFRAEASTALEPVVDAELESTDSAEVGSSVPPAVDVPVVSDAPVETAAAEGVETAVPSDAPAQTTAPDGPAVATDTDSRDETAVETAAPADSPEPSVADADVAVETGLEPAHAPAESQTAVLEAAPQAPALETAPERLAVAAAPEPAAQQAAPEPAAVVVEPGTVAAESAPEAAAEPPAEPLGTDSTTPDAATSDATAVQSDAGDAAVSTQSAPPTAPKPGPRPTPAALAGLSRPAPPRPVAATGSPADAAPEVAEAPAAPPSDSHRFGRVDDDGTVHVLLADGTEHAVGQYAAGTPDEGLAFYVRKYDDLSVEVDLASRRLAQGKAAPEQAAAVVKRARESLEAPSMVGDLASLSARVDALDTLVGEKRAAAAELRAAAKAAALAAREAIVLEAEKLAESTQWKATGDRFKALLDDWKAAPRADRTSEQALWKRFSHARSQFDKHRRQYFARLDGERSEAKQVKEALVAEAEGLQGSTDWGATAGAYRDLMARWKASGRASKADEDALWARFRAAQDAFFSGRNAALGERDAGFAENLAAKQALLVEAEAIDTSDLKGAKAALRGIQERWEKIGHVPRGDKERIEARLRRVEEKVRHGEQEQWRRSNPEAKARADATVAQFSTSLEKLEKERDKATAAGDARKAEDIETRITTTKALLEAAERAAEEFSG